MANVYQNFDFHQPVLHNMGEPMELQGQWHSKVFKNDNPIVLELACGRGEYAVGLAQLEPEKNYIGIDLKGNRLWTGATRALEEGLPNVAFIRAKIESIVSFFAPGEVDEIWITFPDPFVSGNINRRLTAPPFLNLYRQVCKPGAIINLKTDDPTLFDYTLEIIEAEKLPLLDRKDELNTEERTTGKLAIKTYYEGLNISKSHVIKYLQFSL